MHSGGALLGSGRLIYVVRETSSFYGPLMSRVSDVCEYARSEAGTLLRWHGRVKTRARRYTCSDGAADELRCRKDAGGGGSGRKEAPVMV